MSALKSESLESGAICSAFTPPQAKIGGGFG